MYELDFPYGRKIYVCGICGSMSNNKAEIEDCEALGRPEECDLEVGQKIWDYRECRYHAPNWGRAYWLINVIYYCPSLANNIIGHRKTSAWTNRPVLPAHTLMIDYYGKYENMSGYSSWGYPDTYQEFKSIQEKGEQTRKKIEAWLLSESLKKDIETIGKWYQRQSKIRQLLYRLFSFILGDIVIAEWMGYKRDWR